MSLIRFLGVFCLAAASAFAVPTGSIFYSSNNDLGLDVQLVLNGGSVTVNSLVSGWYDSTGATGGSGNTNYITGLCSDCGGSTYRSFFAFDLTGVSSITDGVLRLNTYTYDSLNPTQTLFLFDVTTSFGTLTGGTGGTGAYDDLGDGTGYGSRVYTSADDSQFADVTLNSAAISAINAAIQGQQTLLIGGTLDDGGASGVPEPATYALVGGALLVLASRRGWRGKSKLDPFGRS